MKILVNDQIHISETGPDDKPALFEHLADREIYRWTLQIPHPYTEADADKWFAFVAERARVNGRPVNWAIRNSENYLIGGLGFGDLTIGETHRAEIGYWLARPYRGRGIATAAVRAACDYAFGEFGLVKISAHVFASNRASERVLEKCGFVQEGYLKSQFRKDGELLDAKAFALFR